jgi:hypothetical protein
VEAKDGVKVTLKVSNCSGALIQCRGQSCLPARPPELRMAVLWDLFKMAPETASNFLQMASMMSRSPSSYPTTTTLST